MLKAVIAPNILPIGYIKVIRGIAAPSESNFLMGKYGQKASSAQPPLGFIE
jgi:hypothetical protein